MEHCVHGVLILHREWEGVVENFANCGPAFSISGTAEASDMIFCEPLEVFVALAKTMHK